ncbi:MAG: hypothetical protein WBP10_07385 [Thermoanaerobaculia bacterium]|jgi:hypothetical protein
MTESPFIVLVLILAVAGLFASTLAVADDECFFEHDGNLVLYRPTDDMEILEVRLADRPNQVVVVRDSDGDALLRSKSDLIFLRHLETEERETGRLQPFQTSPAEPPLHGFEGPGLKEIVDICREEGDDSAICKRLKEELAALQEEYGTPLLLLKDLAEKGLGEYLEAARTTLRDGNCVPPPKESADSSDTPQEEG